jgi:exosome complex RNA-binding protein Rrp42 (RNase PH superfamily)
MSLSNTFGSLVRLLSTDNNETTIVVARVKSINATSNTIDATPIAGGADILDARLRVSEGDSGSMIVVYPKKNTFTLITLTPEGNFVLAIDEWSELLITDQTAFEVRLSGGKMVFNQAENSSDLLILPRLLQELTKVSTFMEVVKNTINSAVPIPGDGGAAIKTALVAALNTTQALSLDGLGNDKIRH